MQTGLNDGRSEVETLRAIVASASLFWELYP